MAGWHPDHFINLPLVYVCPPTAHGAPYPARLIDGPNSENKVCIAPDNDRGMAGEHYWVPRDDVKASPEW